jgi:3-oxoacyl-[acyl-carrier-protein] synthase III
MDSPNVLCIDDRPQVLELCKATLESHGCRNTRFDSVCIKSTGSYVPSKILTNEEVLANLPTSPQWVTETMGIRERHVAKPEEYTSDLAARAGLDAIASAGLEPNDIDLIIVATATPDRKMPSSACIAQTKMGISNRCAAFDVGAVCAGFVYGITIAGQFIQNGMYERALVIGADTFSKVTDWNHRDCVVFGDGAGAVVLERKDRENGFFSSILLAEGEGADHFTVYPGDAYFKMNGKAVYDKATTAVPECILEILRINGLGLEDVSMIVPHQATARVLKRVAEVLNVPFSRFQTNLESYANTAGATVPLLLDQVNRRGLLRQGDLLLLVSIGAGWTWGASLYRW